MLDLSPLTRAPQREKCNSHTVASYASCLIQGKLQSGFQATRTMVRVFISRTLLIALILGMTLVFEVAAIAYLLERRSPNQRSDLGAISNVVPIASSANTSAQAAVKVVSKPEEMDATQPAMDAVSAESNALKDYSTFKRRVTSFSANLKERIWPRESALVSSLEQVYSAGEFLRQLRRYAGESPAAISLSKQQRDSLEELLVEWEKWEAHLKHRYSNRKELGS